MADDLDDVAEPEGLDDMDETALEDHLDGDEELSTDEDVELDGVEDGEEDDDPLTAVGTEEDDDEDEAATPPAAEHAGEEDDDEDEEDDDEDVEASLDVILKERLVVEDEPEDELEVGDVDDRSEPTERVLPKQPDEFVCRSCFLVKHPSQLANSAKMLCRDCV
jgi:Domain of unknown function (DUF4193)